MNNNKVDVPSGTLSHTPDLEKFCFGLSLSIIKTCYRLSSRKVDAPSVINWTVVDQLCWHFITRGRQALYDTVARVI